MSSSRQLVRKSLATTLDHIVRVGILRDALEAALIRLGHCFPRSGLIDVSSYHLASALGREFPNERTRVATLDGELHLVVTLRDYFHRHLYFTGEYEPETTRLLLKIVRPADVVFDIGANIGYFTALAASRGAVVHAFEPNDAMADQLERTISLNRFDQRVTLNRTAVAGTDGTASLFLSPDVNNSGLSSLVNLHHLGEPVRVEVPTVRLDNYCRTHEVAKLRLMKIDVEGAESHVFAGAQDVLRRVQPEVIICELGGCDGGSQADQIRDVLSDADYVPFLITHRGLQPIFDEQVFESRSKAQLPPNVCFLRRGSDAQRELVG